MVPVAAAIGEQNPQLALKVNTHGIQVSVWDDRIYTNASAAAPDS